MLREKIYNGITIDSATTKDMDDAIWCKKTPAGDYSVRVFVTEITQAVPIDSDIDRLAFERTATEYRDNSAVRPMLPRYLSEDYGSLLPTRKRSSIVVSYLFDQYSLQIRETKIFVAPFISIRKFDYREAAGYALETNEKIISELKTEEKIFPVLAKITNSLLKNRKIGGALSMAYLAEGWEVNEDMQVVKLDTNLRNIGYLIVQEFAVLTNQIISKTAVENEIPFLFRNHRTSFNENADAESSLVRELMNREVKRYLQDKKGFGSRLPEAVFKMLRSGIKFERAIYAPVNTGHAGLALPVYGHNTSPLRRYADLVNQRQLRAFLDGEPYPYNQEKLAEISDHLNEVTAQRQIAKAEAQQEIRRKNRLKLVEEINAPIASKKIYAAINEMSDGEFNKTMEIWLQNTDSENDLSEANRQGLIDAVKSKITADNFPPKTAVLFLTTGMTDAPRRANTANESVSQVLTTHILDLMAQDVSRALSVWVTTTQLFPDSGWKMPEFVFPVSPGKPNFECRAELKLADGTLLTATGYAGQKQKAKSLAAFYLWVVLKGENADRYTFAVENEQTVLPAKKEDSREKSKRILAALKPHFEAGNFKSALFEFAQGLVLRPPVLKAVENTAGKKPFFTVEATFDFADKLLTATGKDFSKRAAEQEASRRILAKISAKCGEFGFGDVYPNKNEKPGKVNDFSEPIQEKRYLLPAIENDNYTGAIDIFFRYHKLQFPKYSEFKLKSDELSNYWKVKIETYFAGVNYSFTAEDAKLKNATREAAKKLYLALQKKLMNE